MEIEGEREREKERQIVWKWSKGSRACINYTHRPSKNVKMKTCLTIYNPNII